MKPTKPHGLHRIGPSTMDHADLMVVRQKARIQVTIPGGRETQYG